MDFFLVASALVAAGVMIERQRTAMGRLRPARVQASERGRRRARKSS